MGSMRDPASKNKVEIKEGTQHCPVASTHVHTVSYTCALRYRIHTQGRGGMHILALKRQRDILGLLGSRQSILSGFRPMREPVSKIKLGTREMVPRVFATNPGDLICVPKTHMMDGQN